MVVILLLSAYVSPSLGAVAGEIIFYSNRVDLVQNGNYARWAREFQAINPGTRVQVEGVADYEQSMSKRFEARDYGDVVLVPRDMPRETYPKYFLPLNELQLQDKIYFADNWSYQGKHYAYTQGVIAEGLVYNKRLLREFGIKSIPRTLDELMGLAQQIKAAGKVPFAMNLGAGWPLQQWDKAVMALSGDGNYFAQMVTDTQPFAVGKPYHQSLKIAHTLFKSG